MNLPAVCIRRPVFTTMLTTLPIVLGAFSYMRLGVDLQPKIDLPFVFVTTTLRGASVEEMETQVTRPIEEAVNTIEGVDELRSMTNEGVSRVFIRFVLEKSGDSAAQEVQNKVNAMVSKLPRGTTLPVIDKMDADSSPVITIVVSGKRDLREVTEISRRKIKENIETVPGVGSVSMAGDRRRTIQVWVDTDKLNEFGLSIAEVRRALESQNLELPGGRVEQGDRELVLRVMGRYPAERFNELVVANKGDYPIRIKDIGSAKESVEDPRTLARLDGEPAVSVIVLKQSGANTVEVVRRVKERLELIRKIIPDDLSLEIVRDQSVFIERSIEEVKFHLILASLLVSATILLFIQDWRTTLIATSAIPASIIATFACMYALDFSLNNITMLGLVLAIGIVIDDAVVVHENIFRHMEEHGRDAMEASRIGTAEIALAVMATSLSLVVIFVPVAFMQGQVGRLFNSFGLTIAFAILVSLFVSFTLTPMLCSRFLKVEPGGGHGSKSNRFYRALEDSYAAVLAWSLRHKFIVSILSMALIASGYPLLAMTAFEYLPRDDTSEFLVQAIAPPGTSLDRMDKQFAEFESRLKKLRGVERLFTTIGDTSGRVTRGAGDVTKGLIYVKIADLDKRDFSQFDVMRDAREILRDFPDMRTSVSDVDPLRTSSYNFAVDVNLVGPDLKKLGEYTDRLMASLRKVPGLADVDTTNSMSKPELAVAIDRERAADLGVSAEQVASALAVLVGGEPVSTFKEGDEQFDVWLRALPKQRTTRQSIDDLTIPSAEGALIPVGSITKSVEQSGPTQIERLNRMRRTTIGANLDGISTGEAVDAMMREAKALNMEVGYDYRKGYRSRNLDEVASNFLIAFGLSLVFMYMVLAAQFESFTDPITILLALPLTFPFALVSLKLLNQPMDIYAIFGLFMLVGIVKKNGILQVDYTNELRRRGVPRDQAILEANRTRLRPILMTTLMLVAGMIPIAIGQGAGSAARASLAKVIIGGQMLSLLPTLLITPVAYAMFDSFGSFIKRRSARRSRVAPSYQEIKEPERETQLVG